MEKGQLVLVPTPISDGGSLDPKTIQKLSSKDIFFAFETPKLAEKRFKRWGISFPDDTRWIEYSEHSSEKEKQILLSHLKSGVDIYLVSDGGLPAFCDPGRDLIDQCHRQGIRVTATSFGNSVALAMAMSGFPIEPCLFYGFLPQKTEERETAWNRILNHPETLVLMDTPYRLKKTIEELSGALKKQTQESRLIFLGLDLNEPTEKIIRATAHQIQTLTSLEKSKFVLIIGPKGFR